jgi:hypothetical protein
MGRRCVSSIELDEKDVTDVILRLPAQIAKKRDELKELQTFDI